METVNKEFVYSQDRETMDDISDYKGPVKMEKKKTKKEKAWSLFKQNLMVPFLILGMVLGIAIGLGIREADEDFSNDKRRIMYLNFPGELFMRLLKMVILPLIISSLISGMANLPAEAAGRMGGRAITYYITTTFLSVLLGILVVCTIKPGDLGDEDIDEKKKDRVQEPVDSLLDLIR